MEVRAILKHTRTAPRKARLVADMIRGKNVNDAMNTLAFLRKRVAQEFQKLLKSAIANAEENHKVVDVDDLVIKRVNVDEGVTWKRNMPRARGMATMIRKRTSHITVILDEKLVSEE
ncbi:MAG: 50S ribosomal protein L22 [Nitrospinaceae bacterium]|nr:MAG: 50S ribosomal protein L22 [Nitrospinaceae bacterium]